jgi:hypothetical protein
MYLLRILFLLGFCQTLFAQELLMYPNQGQWDNRILYNMPLSSGRLYIEDQGLTFFLSNATFHNHETKEAHDHEDGTAYHAIKHRFIHAQTTAAFTAQDSSAHYHNYFIGNDQSKWKSKVHGVGQISAADFFAGGARKLGLHPGGGRCRGGSACPRRQGRAPGSY